MTMLFSTHLFWLQLHLFGMTSYFSASLLMKYHSCPLFSLNSSLPNFKFPLTFHLTACYFLIPNVVRSPFVRPHSLNCFSVHFIHCCFRQIRGSYRPWKVGCREMPKDQVLVTRFLKIDASRVSRPLLTLLAWRPGIQHAALTQVLLNSLARKRSRQFCYLSTRHFWWDVVPFVSIHHPQYWWPP